jgi:hypothetical protein
MSLNHLTPLVCLLTCVPPCLGQWVTQALPLREGWNGVYLSVQPYPASCAEQFSALPVESVQRHNRALSTAQFSTDPADLFIKDDEWLSWRPDDGHSAYMNTLRNVIGNATYLIKATSNCTWVARGRPVLPRLRWRPDTFNMVGFQVALNPTAQPTFADFFRNAPDIDGTPSRREERIFQIGADLEHLDITGQTSHRQIEPGIAYWVMAQGASRYAGGLYAYTADPDGLAFGSRHDELVLFVRNDHGADVTLTLRHAPSDAAPPGHAPVIAAAPLIQLAGSVTNRAWTAWPVEQSQSLVLRADETRELRLGVDRGQLQPPVPTNGTWQSILQVESSCGSFVRVSISARYGQPSERYAAWPYGLWVGKAELNAVSFVTFNETAGGEAATDPHPASDTFPLRLILHAGRDGVTRLLSRAILAAETLPDDSVVSRIYADEEDVPSTSEGVTRVSSPAFGLTPPVALSGTGFGTSLAGAYVIGYDDPVNPFKHVYHPAHDNRRAEDGSVLPEGAESYSISNRIELAWGPPPDHGNGATLWNPDETTTGTYTHVISNLRQVPVTVRGAFTLRRVSRVGTME